MTHIFSLRFKNIHGQLLFSPFLHILIICDMYSFERGFIMLQNDEGKVEPYLDDTIFEQIMSMHKSGEVDMLDIKAVFDMAISMEYYKLADYILADRNRYRKFILSGKRE